LLKQQSEFLKSSVDPKRRMARAETRQEMVNKYALVTPDAQAMRHENTQTRLSARQDLMWRQRFFYWLKLMRKARTDIMYQASQRIVGEFVKTFWDNCGTKIMRTTMTTVVLLSSGSTGGSKIVDWRITIRNRFAYKTASSPKRRTRPS
jgi:hypothetical protein